MTSLSRDDVLEYLLLTRDEQVLVKTTRRFLSLAAKHWPLGHPSRIAYERAASEIDLLEADPPTGLPA